MRAGASFVPNPFGTKGLPGCARLCQGATRPRCCACGCPGVLSMPDPMRPPLRAPAVPLVTMPLLTVTVARLHARRPLPSMLCHQCRPPGRGCPFGIKRVCCQCLLSVSRAYAQDGAGAAIGGAVPGATERAPAKAGAGSCMGGIAGAVLIALCRPLAYAVAYGQRAGAVWV